MEQELLIKCKDINLYAKLFACEKSKTIVICSHGFASTYKDVEFPIARRLVKNGYSAIVFDYYNGSDESKSGGKLINVLLKDEIEQLKTIIEYVKGLGYSNIYLLGQSQGALVSTLSATKEIKGLILYYPAFNLKEEALEKYGSFENIPDYPYIFDHKVTKEYFKQVFDINLCKSMENYSNDVLILHGTADELVNIKYSRQYIKHFKNAMLIEYPDEVHGFTAAGRLKAIKDVVDYLSSKETD